VVEERRAGDRGRDAKEALADIEATEADVRSSARATG